MSADFGTLAGTYTGKLDSGASIHLDGAMTMRESYFVL